MVVGASQDSGYGEHGQPPSSRSGGQWADRYRWGLGFLGLVPIGYACALMWHNRMEGAGVAGLLALGGLLIFLALAGQLPEELSAGGASFKRGCFPKGDFEDVLARMPRDARAEVEASGPESVARIVREIGRTEDLWVREIVYAAGAYNYQATVPAAGRIDAYLKREDLVIGVDFQRVTHLPDGWGAVEMSVQRTREAAMPCTHLLMVTLSELWAIDIRGESPSVRWRSIGVGDLAWSVGEALVAIANNHAWRDELGSKNDPMTP